MRRRLPVMLVATPLSAGALATAAFQQDVSSDLTGLGASKKSWATHHRADRDPKLSPGCCFLPKQRDGQDRYFDVLYDHGRVFSYEMHFNPPVSARNARRLILRHEPPPDARLSRDVRKATCEQIEYRSSLLKRALGTAVMGVEFSRTAVGGRYRGIVGAVLVNAGLGATGGC